LPACIRYGLFGVPDTARAASQIQLVKPGEKLFLYVHGAKVLHGVYEAITQPFKEAEPKAGPWNDRSEDAKHGWYPFRIEVKPFEPFKEALSLGEVERLGIGLNEDVFRARPSVVYITEDSAEKLATALRSKNANVSRATACTEKYPSKPSSNYDLQLSKGSAEEKLTLSIQRSLGELEDGFQPLQSFYPLRSAGGRNVWIDILALDHANNYVVVELKREELQETIWNQVFQYAGILRSQLSVGSKVRTVVICADAEQKIALAYAELRSQLKDPTYLRVYKYREPPHQPRFQELYQFA
jgi:hypothetical protein